MREWSLRKTEEKRIRAGHPWVFSNELSQSPKGAAPGELVRLLDGSGGFVAMGYGNPHSLIAFRALAYREDSEINDEFFFERFQKAQTLRRDSGLLIASHRLVFAENDYLPGLIIDRYLSAESRAQVFVVQSSTAGMDQLQTEVFAALEKFVGWENEQNESELSWSDTTIISANTSHSRTLEGLKPEDKVVIKPGKGILLENFKGKIAPASELNSVLAMEFDLIRGQKTGFFLDQRENIKRLIEIVSHKNLSSPLRVLDICTYVGQWSSQLAQFARSKNLEVECTLLDSSESALQFAQKNVQSFGAKTIPIKTDVLEGLRNTLDRHYDIVICDPPALIKKKKDLPNGRAAYAKLNRDAIKRVKAGGVFVSCSCSGLFETSDFRYMLSKISFSKDYHTQWVHQGFHSPDHPQRLEFPEGSYLKCLMGVVTKA